jgi:hypothetical protein
VGRKLSAAAISSLLAVFLAGPANAAGSTMVDHFTDGPFPDTTCGVSGTTTVHGTSIVREGSDGTFFQAGTFWAVFTADNGKSITVFATGPVKQTSPPVIDEQAGTVTLLITVVGLPEKLSITHGRTLSRDAGTVTFTNVFEYSGDPNDPVGDFISSDIYSVHGPHPDLFSDFERFCLTYRTRKQECSSRTVSSRGSKPRPSSTLFGQRVAEADGNRTRPPVFARRTGFEVLSGLFCLVLTEQNKIGYMQVNMGVSS